MTWRNAAGTPAGTCGSRLAPSPLVFDLRGSAADGGRLELRWPAGHRVVVSGLPGSGKSTLMRRAAAAVPGSALIRIDSQDTRERWARRLPGWVPYAVYRPAVRLAHYARLGRALRSSAGVIVHDCGRTAWVRRWLGWDARRRGRQLHLVVLDVPAGTALAGQRTRGRTVSGYVFERHRRAVARLVAQVAAGRLPDGCASAALLDRAAAGALRDIGFGFGDG
ncbi:AAA family ATPase [Streptomyces sp. NBC_01803]|uniref:AAA family ATPase n=1 Tax=Streptomyces sp. NBC_01803 TaxID=2975946 RepID=UPI002DD94370|nr:AAA family ATPase [Streptomyces sp. NBC_01803]WSA43172.1 ATP-binding protein [Streptomyces sp. NBC_01803]